MKSFNILLSCSSDKIHLLSWMKKSVNKFDNKILIYAGDSNNQVISKYFCDEFWHMPQCKKSNYLEILNYCKKKNIRIIIPSSDKELLFWATHKEKLKKNKIYVMVSEKQTIQNCLDKLRFFNTLKNFKSVIFTTKNIKNFKSNEKIFVKNRYGSGSLNNMIISSKEASKVKKKDLKNFVFQKFINSKKEISIDCYFAKNNKLKKVVPRLRDYVKFGESVVTTTIDNKNFFNEIKKIGLVIKFTGHVLFQCFFEKTKIKIFECNPRIGGGSFMSYLNYMDSIYFFILEHMYPNKKIYIKKKININSKLIIFKKTKFIN